MYEYVCVCLCLCDYVLTPSSCSNYCHHRPHSCPPPLPPLHGLIFDVILIRYPVSEATSSGFLWLSGQAFGIAFTLAMSALKGKWFVHRPEAFGPDTKNATGCGEEGPPQTMEGACWFMVACGILACAFALPLYTRCVVSHANAVLGHRYYQTWSLDAHIYFSPLKLLGLCMLCQLAQHEGTLMLSRLKCVTAHLLLAVLKKQEKRKQPRELI